MGVELPDLPGISRGSWQHELAPSLTMPSWPPCIHQQWWSPLNVPFLWSAAGDAATTPVLDWPTEVTASMQGMVDFCERAVNPGEAVRSGWSSLRSVMRTWGVDSREDLRSVTVVAKPRICRHTARKPHPSQSTRSVVLGCVQDKRSCGVGGRVRAANSVGTRLCHEAPSQARIRVHQQPGPRWSQVDAQMDVDLTDMLRRIPMLKTCLRLVRGKLRLCWAGMWSVRSVHGSCWFP